MDKTSNLLSEDPLTPTAGRLNHKRLLLEDVHTMLYQSIMMESLLEEKNSTRKRVHKHKTLSPAEKLSQVYIG